MNCAHARTGHVLHDHPCDHEQHRDEEPDDRQYFGINNVERRDERHRYDGPAVIARCELSPPGLDEGTDGEPCIGALGRAIPRRPRPGAPAAAVELEPPDEES